METHEMLSLLERIMKERDQFYKRGMELAQKKCQSDDTNEICAAFVKAQGEFLPLTKNSKGYNYKYCQLDQVLNVLRPVLNKHGLIISQHTDEHNILYTRIRHESGQWFESRIKLPESDSDGKRSLEQSMGSSLTYMRRYQILTILGAAPENEDDDAAYNKRM